MKTLAILTPYFYPRVGGVETHVWETSTLLAEQGYSITIITAQHELQLPLHETIAGMQVCRIPHSAVGKKFPTWFWMFRHLRTLWVSDIVQVHDVWWWLAPFSPLLSHKLFITFHGWEGKFPVALSAKLHRLLAAATAQGTVHIGKWIQEFYMDRPTNISYGGTRENDIVLLNTKDCTAPHFVFLGRLAWDTSTDIYLELAALLKKNYPKAKITWIGDGELRPLCEKYGTVTGFTNHPEKYLRTATFVGASSYLSILLAQSFGHVVCGIYSNQLKKQYLNSIPTAQTLIISATARQCFAQISVLLHNPEYFTQLKHAAQQQSRVLTWQKVTEQYIQLWHRK